MIEERLQDISVVYHIKSILSDTVNVVDGFPEKEIRKEDLPIVAVENRSADFTNLELGTNASIINRGWIIYIYAINKTQRDYIAYEIAKDLFKNKLPVYNYDEGFPPDTSPSKIGCLYPSRVSVKIPQIDPNLVSMFYRNAEVYYYAIYKSN